MVIGEAPRSRNCRGYVAESYTQSKPVNSRHRGSVPKGSEASKALYCGDLTGREKTISVEQVIRCNVCPLILIARGAVLLTRGFGITKCKKTACVLVLAYRYRDYIAFLVLKCYIPYSLYMAQNKTAITKQPRTWSF